MVSSDFGPLFEKRFRKIKNDQLKLAIRKQLKKILDDPNIGKPMRYGRKGTRELYVGAFRLSYAYLEDEDKIVFLDLYHKDEQ